MFDRFYLLRVVRTGPLTVGRLWFDHCEPGTDNRLDRGNLVPIVRCEIGGREHPPELLLDRLGVRWSGDIVPPARVIVEALKDPASLSPRPRNHWAYCQEIPPNEGRYRTDHLRWLRQQQPSDPRCHPYRPLRPRDLLLPNIEAVS